MSIEKITINGKDYTMTEARELYNELRLIFGEKSIPFNPMPYPLPQYPIAPSYPADKWFYPDDTGHPNPLDYPYKITCGEIINPKSTDYFLVDVIGGGSSN